MSIDYVRGLKLQDVAEISDTEFETRSMIDDARQPDQTQSAAVAGGSIAAFAAGLLGTLKDDVLDTLQLAQRAADAEHNRFEDPRDWFKKVVEVLSNTGWVIDRAEFTAHDLEEGEYQVAKSAVKVLAALATGPATAVLQAALTALESLAGDDGYITLFEHYGLKNSIGSFLMTTAEANANGTVSAALGGFELKGIERRRKFLFVKWRERNVTFWAATQKAVFNPTSYDAMRNEVRDMLGASRANYLKMLKLA